MEWADLGALGFEYLKFHPGFVSRTSSRIDLSLVLEY